MSLPTGGPGHHHLRKTASFESISFSEATASSALQANQTFFDEEHSQQVFLAPGPSHTASITWKSVAIKEKEEFERHKQRVRHFAPEQFRSVAKPTYGPSEIFPKNVAEWIQHKRYMLAMREIELLKSAALLKEQIEANLRIPKTKRKIMPAFGGKRYTDGLSPVLMLPTIWSSEHMASGQVTASWPSAEEMQWNGDNRQSRLARTKCGRYLPPPRLSSPQTASFHDRPFIRPLPLDETGPIFSSGPRPDEVEYQNSIMDNDPTFEAMGAVWLGTELMAELGEWRLPFVPDWQQAIVPTGDQTMDRYPEMQNAYLADFAEDMVYNSNGGMVNGYYATEQEQQLAWKAGGHDGQFGFWPDQNDWY